MHLINKVIRVAGMKRNGNHGIVNWIFAQHKGKATFCNALHGSEYLADLREDPIEAFSHCSDLHSVNLSFPCEKELLMLTYEDHPPGSVIEPKPLEHYEQWIGHSVIREFNVTILRDPFNFFASRIQAELNGTYSLECWGDCFSKGDSTKLWSKWKTYARRFLSFTASSSPDLIPISYNHWIKSIDYRKCICQDLNVTLINDEERKIVTGWGAGSSFNQGIWQEPEIYMNRWRAYIGHHVLAEAVRDEELVKLAREIFGDVIDVDFIVNSIEKLQ
jgi:hypothetical protein